MPLVIMYVCHNADLTYTLHNELKKATINTKKKEMKNVSNHDEIIRNFEKRNKLKHFTNQNKLEGIR